MRLVGLATLAIAVALSGSAVMAKSKCPKQCKQQFVSTDKSCKATCKTLSTKAEKKSCKQTCATTFKSEKKACKTATNPTFPGCSPSGAFVD
jgi:hypothetical protein